MPGLDQSDAKSQRNESDDSVGSQTHQIGTQRFILYEAAWILNGLTFLVTVGWLLSDGYLSRVNWPTWHIPGLESFTNSKSTDIEGLSAALEVPRLRFAKILASICAATWCIMLLGFASRSLRYRSVRAILGLMLNAVCWIVLLTSWSGIIQWGKDVKVSAGARPLQAFAEHTYQNWELLTSPDVSLQDERLKEVPWIPFNPYPLRKPRMAFFLGEQPIPNTSLTIRSIEWTDGTAIRLELSGDQLGNWLEWRVGSDVPTDFEGGLGNPMRVAKWRKLSDHLFIVQYR